MPKKPVQRGGRYFEYRNGLGGFSWEGMISKVDPGGHPPNRPRYLGNIRIQGGVLTAHPRYGNRGTMVPRVVRLDPGTVNADNRPPFGTDTTDKWKKHWIGEHNSVGGTRLWWGGYPALGYGGIPADWFVINGGAFVGYIDTDWDPPMNDVAYFPAADTWAPSIEKFSREVYIGDYGKLRKLQLVNPPAGVDPATILSAPADETIASFPGFRCAVLQEYNGKLYFLLSDPFTLGNGEIWSWDGFQVVQEYVLATPAASGAAAVVYKNQLVFSIAGYGSIVYFDPTGGWATATLGGFDSSPFLNSMAQYRDKLYIVDGVDKIHSWDGAALALAHTIAPTSSEAGRGGGGTTPIVALAFCCSVLSDRFYFFYTDTAVTPNEVFMGCLDDKAEAAYQWNDVFQYNYFINDFGGYPSEGGNAACTALAEYRGRLWAALGNYPTGNSMIWTHRNQFTPYDGWFQCGPQEGPGQSFPIFSGANPIYFFRSI